MTGFPENAYRGFVTSDEAYAEFALGLVAGVVNQQTVQPKILMNMEHLLNMSQDELVNQLHYSGNGRWYVVYQGKCTGVYPAWRVLYYEP